MNFRLLFLIVLVPFLIPVYAEAQDNTPPVFQSTPIVTIKDDSYYNYLIDVIDAQSDLFELSATQIPEWLKLSKRAIVTNSTGNKYSFEDRSVDGGADVATFDRMNGTALDNKGNIYFTTGASVRLLRVDGSIETIAGGSNYGFVDGIGGNAQFRSLGSLVFAPDSSLLIADYQNAAIRNVTREGKVTTLIKNAGISIYSTPLEEIFGSPTALEYDSQGNLVFLDNLANRVRKIAPNGEITTIAGLSVKYCGINGAPTYCEYTGGYKNGPALEARFKNLKDLVIDKDDNIYIIEDGSKAVRKISSDGFVTTLAGINYSNEQFPLDGVGSDVRFLYPLDITLAPNGNLLIVDSGYIRVLDPEKGEVTTVAGYEYDAFDQLANGGLLSATFFNKTGQMLVADGGFIRAMEIKGFLHGNPRSQVGVHQVIIKATDSEGESSNQEFEIEVTDDVFPTLELLESYNQADKVYTDHLGFRVSFSEQVRNIDVTDFYIESGTVEGSISSISKFAKDSVFLVQVNELVGSGDFKLGLKESNDITDFAGNALSEESILASELLVLPSNNPPEIISNPDDAALGQDNIFKYLIEVEDENLASLDFSTSSGLPDWLTIRKANWFVEHLAGSTAGNDVGNLDVAKFNNPKFIETDFYGNIYVSDQYYIKRISPKGIVSILENTKFLDVVGMSIDKDGNLILAVDDSGISIIRLSPAGEKILITGGNDSGIVDGDREQASFENVKDLKIDKDDNIYVIDASTIRRVSPLGEVTTLAGTTAGYVDGIGANAKFYYPNGIAISPEGYLLVTESNRIRKVTFSGEASTFAGGQNGYADGHLSEAKFGSLRHIKITEFGDVYLSENGNFSRVRLIDSRGIVSTVAGVASGSENGLGTEVQLAGINSLALGVHGELFLANYTKLKRVTHDFELTGDGTNQSDDYNITINVSDNDGQFDSQDIDVSVRDNTLPTIDQIVIKYPNKETGFIKELVFEVTFSERIISAGIGDFDLGLTQNVVANLFRSQILTDSSKVEVSVLIDSGQGNITLKVNSDNNISDNSGNMLTDTDVKGENQFFRALYNSAPNSYLEAQKINAGSEFSYEIPLYDVEGQDLKVTLLSDLPEGLELTSKYYTSTLSSTEEGLINGDLGTSRFRRPSAIAFDSIGGQYIADRGNNVIRKVSTNNIVRTLASYAIPVDDSEQEYLSGSASSMVVDSRGNLFIADPMLHIISKISPEGEVSVFTGMPNAPGYQEGNGKLSRFNEPSGITIDYEDNLYVADLQNHAIRKITPAGEVTTFMGTGSSGYLDGTVKNAVLNEPTSVYFDPYYRIWYIGEKGNKAIRLVNIDSTVVTLFKEVDDAKEFSPSGITGDETGVIYFSDESLGSIYKISNGNIRLISGSAKGYQDGPGAEAKFSNPSGLAYFQNALYIPDGENSAIRKVLLTTNLLQGIVANEGGSSIRLSVKDPYGLTYTGDLYIYVYGSELPKVVYLSPENHGNTNYYNDVSIEFSKLVYPGAGKVQLRRYRDGSLFDEIDVSSERLTIDETKVEFHFKTMEAGGVYYVVIPDNVFSDGKNYFSGFTNKDDWMFALLLNANTTVPPSIVSVLRTGDLTEVHKRDVSYFYVRFNDYITLDQDDINVLFEGESASVVDFQSSTSNSFIIKVKTNGYGELSLEFKSDGAITNYYGVAFSGDVLYSEKFLIQNIPPNFISNPVLEVADNATYSYSIEASDEERDGLSIEAVIIPEWLELVDDETVSVSTYISGGLRNQENIITGEIFTRNEAEIVEELDYTIGGATDGQESVYLLGQHKITVVSKGNTYQLGPFANGYQNGSLTEAKFHTISAIDVDNIGNIYIVDQRGTTIRKIDLNGQVTTLAGSGISDDLDGVGEEARFKEITEIKVVSSDSILVGDYGKLKLISGDGTVKTLAGSGNFYLNQEGNGLDVGIGRITGIDLDSDGNIFMVDASWESIKKFDLGGNISIVAGNRKNGYENALHLDGPISSAVLQSPVDILVDNDGNLYVSEYRPNTIRKINFQKGTVETVAGLIDSREGYVDGKGIDAQFLNISILMMLKGDILALENGYYPRVRKIVPDKKLVGNPSGQSGSHDVSLKVTDHSGDFTTQTFTIIISDATAPIFTSETTATIVENSTDVAYTILATDTNTITYSLGTDNDESLFELDGGVVSFKSSPDFELPSDANSDNAYEIEVIANDGLNETSQLVTISVTDVDEDAPVFTSETTASVAENSADAAYTITATDANEISYSLGTDNDESLFDLDGGTVAFKSSPDFELPSDANSDNVYEIEVIANDGLNESSQLVAISVTDVDEEAPVFTSETTASVAENSGDAAYTITATDSNEISYSLGTDNDESLFEIDGGVVSFKSSPDFEQPSDANSDNAYEIEVIANDGLNEASQMVTISVANVNEAPVSLELETYSIIENNVNGSAFSKLLTIDPDNNDSHTYELVNGDGNSNNEMFLIQDDLLITNTVFDFEEHQDLEIRIRSSDNEGLFIEQKIQLTIVDEPEAEFGALPESVEFGIVKVGEANQKSISIENVGDAVLEITSITLSSGFGTNWSSGTIESNSVQEIMITFTPEEAVEYSGQLEIQSNLAPIQIVVNGVGEGEVVTGIEKEIERFQNLVNVFPVPTSNDLTIDLDISIVSKVKSIELRDLSGRLTIRYEGNIETQQRLELGYLTEGLYFIEVDVEGTKVFKKVLIRR
jgi:sugar lactone lactonase YvrE